MRRLLPLLLLFAACTKTSYKPDNTPSNDNPYITNIKAFAVTAGDASQGTGFSFFISNPSNNVKIVALYKNKDGQMLGSWANLQTGTYKSYDYHSACSGNTYKYHFEITLTDNTILVGNSFTP